MLAWLERLEYMPTVEERVAYLEGRLQDQDVAFDDLRSSIRTLDERLTGRIDGLDERLTGRIDVLDERLTGRLDALDAKVDRVFYELESRISRLFNWSVGIQMSVLLAVIAALLTLRR